MSDPTDRRNAGAVQSASSPKMQPSLPHIAADREVHDGNSAVVPLSLPGSAERSKESATSVRFSSEHRSDGGRRTSYAAGERRSILAEPGRAWTNDRTANGEESNLLPGQQELPGSSPLAAQVAAGTSHRKKRQLNRARSFTGIDLGQFDAALTRLTNPDTPFALALVEKIDHR